MSGGLISATFVEQGTLGLKFAPLERASQVGVQILSINPGTQAAMQPWLRPGLKLLSVESQGQTSSGLKEKSYREVIELLKTAGRPSTLRFEPGNLPPPPSKPEPTGLAAAKALQQHIAQHGSADITTITRLRRASLVPVGNPAPGGRAQPSQAEMMARAAEEVATLGPDMEMVPDGATVSVTLIQPGPLGIKFRSPAPDSPLTGVSVAAINEGSQAEATGKLKPGLQLATVQTSGKSHSCGHTSYTDLIGLLRSAGRPITLRFREPDSPPITPTAPPSVGTKAGSAKQNEIESLYKKYNPEKLADVPALLAKYGEDRLIAMVRKKYGVLGGGETLQDGATVVVALEKAGPLGIRFRDEGSRGVVVANVSPGSQAGVHVPKGLAVGLRLLTVVMADGSSYAVRTLSYADVIGLLREASRPVTLRFKVGVSTGFRAPVAAHPVPGLSATFAMPGTLGLKFTPLDRQADTGLQVLGINTGTQAAEQPQLQPGLVLVAMESHGKRKDGLKVEGYQQVIGMLKTAGRPVTLHFELGMLPVRSSKARAVELQLFGKDAAKALQREIATNGTENVQKIALLRRASLAPAPMLAPRLQPSSTAAAPTPIPGEGLYQDTAAIMAAAAAEVLESTDDEQTAMSLAAANITLAPERRVADAAGSQAEQCIVRVMGRGCGAETNISNEGERKKVKGAALAAEQAKMAEAEAAVRAKQFEEPAVLNDEHLAVLEGEGVPKTPNEKKGKAKGKTKAKKPNRKGKGKAKAPKPKVVVKFKHGAPDDEDELMENLMMCAGTTAGAAIVVALISRVVA
jgi:hypothetical protein